MVAVSPPTPKILDNKQYIHISVISEPARGKNVIVGSASSPLKAAAVMASPVPSVTPVAPVGRGLTAQWLMLCCSMALNRPMTQRCVLGSRQMVHGPV